jgi:hypothetical protein
LRDRPRVSIAAPGARGDQKSSTRHFRQSCICEETFERVAIEQMHVCALPLWLPRAAALIESLKRLLRALLAQELQRQRNQ